MWCPRSDVVIDCIDSWSLPSYLLCERNLKKRVFFVADLLFNVLPIVCVSSLFVFVLLCITLCLF